MNHIKKHQYKPQSGPIVQPRDPAPFKPLTHFLSTQGRRPGADDFRAWGGRHL